MGGTLERDRPPKPESCHRAIALRMISNGDRIFNTQQERSHPQHLVMVIASKTLSRGGISSVIKFSVFSPVEKTCLRQSLDARK